MRSFPTSIAFLHVLSICSCDQVSLPAVTRERTLSVMKLPISSAAEILGGTPFFLGTRVPVQTLLDYLEGGESINAFLDAFPSVSRDQVIAFLGMIKDRLTEMSL